MANSDKNILITPNVGASAQPTIRFTGADNTPITLRVLDNGTVSFEGTAGQLFSISDGLTGTIFSVNDISGIPSIEVIDTGEIRLAQYGGNVGIGTASASSRLQIVNASATVVPITIQGASAQTASLQEWKNNSASVVASMSASGSLSISGNLSVTGTSNIQGRNTASDTAPASPRVGDGWYDTNTGKQYVWYDSFWVEESSVSNAASIQIGTVTTIDAAAQATVTNSGTTQNAVFNFRIPRGQMGAAPLFYATFYG